MSTRSEAREFCLQFLYHFQLPAFVSEMKSAETADLFERIQSFKETLGIILDSESQSYVLNLTQGILKGHQELEDLLVKYLKNWKLSRISKIERAIFLIAIYELKYAHEVPAKVILNEAIELGKKYSTKDSGAFINGILDNIYKQESNRHE